jgi:hypothetical protein
MSVVAFPGRGRRGASDWSSEELDRLIALSREAGPETSFAIGRTERGDPQFYLLGPAPAHACMLCVSRLGRCYVLEDGAGHLLGEVPSLDRFALEAARAALRGSRSFLARVTLILMTLRLTVEEKLEPILDESEELAARFALQLVAWV